MLKRITENKAFFPILLIVIFSIISAFSLFMIGDDYLWYYSVEESKLEGWSAPNGRLFSNWITIGLVRSTSFRIIFVTVTLFLFIYFIGKLIDFQKAAFNLKYYFGLILLIMIPSATYRETIHWISGFPNYVFSMVIILFYLLFIFKCCFDNYIPPKPIAIFFLLIGLVGGLCVEHITIYNVVLSIALFIIVLKRKKNCILHSFFFMLGTMIACFLMFNNGVYSGIFSGTDIVGGRSLKLDFFDIMQSAFSYVAVHYSKDYWIASVIISVCFTLLLFGKFNGINKPKYLKLTLTVCWLYSGYSVFTSCFSNFRPLNAAMRIVAIETAFSFIYIVSIVYLINVFLDKNGRMRSYIYIISSLLVTLPFILVSPVTPRCFFANYVFWMLLCGEMFFSVINMKKPERVLSLLDRAVGTVSIAFVFAMSLVSLTNRCFDDVRYRYIREQLESGEKSIKIILLPYSEYSLDDLDNGLFTNREHVGNYYFSEYSILYHDIEPSKDKEYIEIPISTYDYYMEKES